LRRDDGAPPERLPPKAHGTLNAYLIERTEPAAQITVDACGLPFGEAATTAPIVRMNSGAIFLQRPEPNKEGLRGSTPEKKLDKALDNDLTILLLIF
jgi:hypothetical protein